MTGKKNGQSFLMRDKRFLVLDRLTLQWVACEACQLSSTRTNLVMYRGNPRAKLMLVGEAPGQDEDERGVPFIGKAGQKLDTLLSMAKLHTERSVCIANLLGCRPPGNRVPTPDELRACYKRFVSLVDVVKPRAFLLLGATASRLAGVTTITKQRGRVMEIEIGDSTYPAVPTFHPSYLCRKGNDRTIRMQMLQDIKTAWRLT